MIGIGIDIGSTAAKAAVVDGGGSVAWTCVQPTGFSSVDASERLREALAAAGYDVAADDVRVVATGYGRVAVLYAHKVVTEITCHGTGAVRLFGDHGTVIDVGGQDTKVIQLKSGRVAKFAMNEDVYKRQRPPSDSQDARLCRGCASRAAGDAHTRREQATASPLLRSRHGFARPRDR